MRGLLLISILTALVLWVSCGPSKEEMEAKEKKLADSVTSAQALESITSIETSTSIPTKKYCDNGHFIIGLYNVNGCEYICFAPNDRGRGEGVCVVHAGNCSNPIHSEPMHAILPGRTGDDPVGKY